MTGDTTGFTPFHLTFAWSPQLPVDVMLGRIQVTLLPTVCGRGSYTNEIILQHSPGALAGTASTEQAILRQE